MKISNKISKLQEGGPMPAEQGQAPAPGAAPEQGGGQDPMVQLVQMAQQAVQGQDCEAAMAVCEGFLQLVQSAQGGGAPAPQEGQPVYKAGGKFVKRVK